MVISKKCFIFASSIFNPKKCNYMRGGSRPGAGRPRIYGKRVQLSILISEETKSKLKELAQVLDKPLAGIVEQLIINKHSELTLT